MANSLMLSSISSYSFCEPGTAYDLERTVKVAAVFIFFLQLVYLAGAAAADAAHYLPAGQRSLQIFHIMHP